MRTFVFAARALHTGRLGVIGINSQTPVVIKEDGKQMACLGSATVARVWYAQDWIKSVIGNEFCSF